MNFRKATEVDVNNLVTLFKSLQEIHSENLSNIFSHNINEDLLRRRINDSIINPDFNIYIAEDKNKIIAATEVIKIVEKNSNVINAREYGLIDKLVVDENYRGAGIGASLIEYVEKELKSSGISDIEIYVWEFNEGAKNLYKKKGYKTICRRMSKSI